MRKAVIVLALVLAGCGAEMTPPAGQGVGLATAKPGAGLAAGVAPTAIPTATTAPTKPPPPTAAPTDIPPPATDILPTATPGPTRTPRPTSPPQPTRPPQPTSATTAIDQMIRDLATIEGVADNRAKTDQIAGLLRDLDAGYTEDAIEIGDTTAQAYAILKQNDMPASIIAIMEEMKGVLELPGMNNQSYNEMVTGWLIIQGVDP